MHHARVLVLACGALASSVACARASYPDAESGNVVQTTGAAVASEPELNIEDLSGHVAGQICGREVQCHDETARDPCLREYLGRARVELATWPCSPAAARARLKECLAAIRGEPCTTDLARRPTLCEPNAKCPDPDSKIVSPGSALADEGI